MAEPASDLDAVMATVRDYLDGMVYGDEAMLRRAFHPSSQIIGHFQDEFAWLSLDDFVAETQAGGAIAAGTSYYWRVVSLELVGDLAVVNVEDDYMDVRYADLLTLIRHEGRWMITHKAFYVHE